MSRQNKVGVGLSLPPAQLTVLQPRTCGSCSLCCKTMGVTSIGKPSNQWCQSFRAGTGCGIYQTRPEQCRNYRCQWLVDSSMPDSMRPDRLGAVIETRQDDELVILYCDQDRINRSLKAPLIMGLVMDLTRHFNVIVVSGDIRRGYPKGGTMTPRFQQVLDSFDRRATI